MTASQLRAAANSVSAKVKKYWPSMVCSFGREQSDGYEFRVKSGKRYGVSVFRDEELPRISPETARAMLRDLVTAHVEHCLGGRK
jgi:hypothetical protein